MSRGVAGAVLLAAAVLGCAQASSPSGGERDVTPPRVVSVTPVPFDTLEDLRVPVVIRFDERLSERLDGVQRFRDAVLVSPATGDVEVDRGRSSLEISIAGGWQPGLVYRVVVLPLFRDLFGNQRVEPIELVFSTGAPIPPTAVAGIIEDRITGQAVAAARIAATRRVDSLVYVAVSDTGGFFALRNIPAGAYDVTAWLDQDRDREVDFQEPQDWATLPLGFQDTLVLPMALLPMDSTPARLVRAEAVDSMRVRLSFDDYFEPGPTPGRASIFLLPDTTFVAEAPLIHGTRLDSLLARERAAADSARAVADSLRRVREDSIRQAAMDSLPPLAPPDTVLPRDTTDRRRLPALPPPGQAADRARRQAGVRPGAAPGGRPGQGPAAVARPSRDLIAILATPLNPATPYLVEVSGVVNIRGIVGGGGRIAFRTPARADTTRTDTVPADTTGGGTIPADTLGIDSIPPAPPPDSILP